MKYKLSIGRGLRFGAIRIVACQSGVALVLMSIPERIQVERPNGHGPQHVAAVAREPDTVAIRLSPRASLVIGPRRIINASRRTIDLLVTSVEPVEIDNCPWPEPAR